MNQMIEQLETANNAVIEQAERTRQIALAKRKVIKEYKKSYDSFGSRLAAATDAKEEMIENEEGMLSRNQRNIVIASKTQNGKTQEIINLIKNAGDFSFNVISCDNRADQMRQLSTRLSYNRVANFLIADLKFDKNGKLKAKSLADLLHTFDLDNKLTFLLLNNASQCSKLRATTEAVLNRIAINKHQTIHDEADQINKSDNADYCDSEPVPAIHTEWVSYFNDIRNFPCITQIKRIWVSATPENCSLIKKVKAKDVLVLPQNMNYVGDIKFTEWSENLQAVSKEVRRIKAAKNGEVILYCTERLNSEQDQISNQLLQVANCIIITYNGKGSVIRSPLERPRKSSQDIAEILADLQAQEPGPIIIVGHALMSRGMSFVARNMERKPFTATVMFYEGTKSTHVVNIAQRIGRITGNSRPDIKERKLYCSKSIFESYQNYLKNQDTIYKLFEKPENAERYVAEIFENNAPELLDIGRDLDRKQLKKANKSYSSACTSSGSIQETVSANASDEEKMKSDVKRWLKLTNKTNIGKIFRKIYESPGNKMLSTQVKAMVESLGRAPQYFGNLTEINHTSKWCLVFSKDSTHHYITSEAVAFANTL